jgi:hypothetical protein
MQTDVSATLAPPTRRPGPAIALFFLSPLVGEFLLGNIPITMIGALVLLAPLYGGGSLLIREIARRFNLTWPRIILLGLAYGVVEETFVTQSLFNPNYVGLRLLDYGYIPALGMSAWWTLFVLTLHTVWSTAVPIALMEALTPGQRRTPWLGPVGLGVTAFLFLASCVVLAKIEYKKGFIASVPQFAGSAVGVVGLVALAFAFRRKTLEGIPAANSGPAGAPAPLRVGGVAFGTGAAFVALFKTRTFMPAGWNVTGVVLLLFATGALNLAWSRRAGWGEKHRLALAAGFLLTYAWYGFVQVPSVGNVSPRVDLIGNAVFATGALLLLAKAIITVRRES